MQKIPKQFGKAFTLVELLIVSGLLAAVALIALSNFIEAETDAENKLNDIELNKIVLAVRQFYQDTGEPPLCFAELLIRPEKLDESTSLVNSDENSNWWWRQDDDQEIENYFGPYIRRAQCSGFDLKTDCTRTFIERQVVIEQDGNNIDISVDDEFIKSEHTGSLDKIVSLLPGKKVLFYKSNDNEEKYYYGTLFFVLDKINNEIGIINYKNVLNQQSEELFTYNKITRKLFLNETEIEIYWTGVPCPSIEKE